MERFTLPRDLYFGEGSLEALKTLKGKKAVVVVGGGSMKRFGFLDKVESYLNEAGIEVKLIEGVEPDPSVETVMNGAAVMREFEPDLIVSIGGGSPIDAAKAMWIFYEYPDFTFEQAVVPFGIPELRQKARFVAIPSTSGTATEVTAFSVITDYKKKIKYPLADFNLTPDIAIVDPDLAQTMPAKLTAHTGMDALTHAIEAYVAGLRSVFSDPLAMQAIVMVKEYLVKSYNGDKEARGQMHLAQCLAGMAFSNALLGITHSMAHKTGAVFHIPHGCANAIFLPYVIQYNAKVCAKRYATIAENLGLQGKTEDELVISLIEMIREMNKTMNIPLNLKEYGITEEEFKENLKYISHNAVLDACTGSNPREIDDEAMEKLFTCTYYGEDVEF
ncbi:iron-containing alcohol dehydrogenase [Clostridium sporogenes]|uniref:Iron-containing alcohol dehydrogenase n=2 Tax=Clostridium TaxID=1485 RepID=A0A6M0SXN8_CLOBO|nr:iron-containing alcohol dehydrogenase [Clostridium sporogenes]NFA60269.1 iron-containing alcohol dehydrogenase [Clostridium botulinum]MDS1002442.1 iron-containing alcohol dehydrogenase [Clostridium sporogenes]NFI72923.1 iron-containing alcohol dehydrogenase [Clostridium sporogenes]NFL71425.1 iron-containing alcohol dehydrogenase [Clostridium sporogenes]NFM22964.1 iron-containing alcohol dehydrogenase [Clostridium sporogenes]